MKASRFFSCAILFLLVASAFAQSDKPSIERWRGLVLDVSTYDDAIKALGQPDKDKPNEDFVPLMYSKWFGNKPQKGFRELKFKNVEGFDSATLSFKNDKLVVIELDMKKQITASSLINTYQTRFVPLVGNYGKGISPTDLEDQNRQVEYPKNFPLAYYMASANKGTIALAYASAGFAEAFASGMANPNGTSGGYSISADVPGLVRKLQLISRKLENVQGNDLLK